MLSLPVPPLCPALLFLLIAATDDLGRCVPVGQAFAFRSGGRHCRSGRATSHHRPTSTPPLLSATVSARFPSLLSPSSCISAAAGVIILPHLFCSPHHTIFHHPRALTRIFLPPSFVAAVPIKTLFLSFIYHYRRHLHQPCHLFCHFNHHSASPPSASPHPLICSPCSMLLTPFYFDCSNPLYFAHSTLLFSLRANLLASLHYDLLSLLLSVSFLSIFLHSDDQWPTMCPVQTFYILLRGSWEQKGFLKVPLPSVSLCAASALLLSEAPGADSNNPPEQGGDGVDAGDGAAAAGQRGSRSRGRRGAVLISQSSCA